MFNKIISKYNTAISKIPSLVNIYDELQNIQNGKYEILINTCRSLYEKENRNEYRKSKGNLPALTFSGEFNGAHKKDNLTQYSNFIIIDVDSVEKEIIEITKQKLFNDKYICATWISPSGCGLKILIGVDNNYEYHKNCFDSIVNYLETNYEINIDKSGSDICRLCYVSYDPNILIKNSFSIFHFQDHMVSKANQNNILVEKKTKIFVPNPECSERVLFYATEGRNLRKNRDTIIKIIKFLNRKNSSITRSYSNWVRVAFAISNSFTYDLGQKYYLELCRFDGHLHDEYKSQHLLEYCYRNRRSDGITFATIIFLAKEHGFILHERKAQKEDLLS